MEYYMDDEKWRLSKNDTYTHSCSSSSKPSSMMRSFSQKNPSSSSSKNSLPRSCSQRNSASKSSSNKSNFTKKCSNLAKEQKAKFYIVKRCIGMLVHWNKHGDS